MAATQLVAGPATARPGIAQTPFAAEMAEERLPLPAAAVVACLLSIALWTAVVAVAALLL